MRWVVNATPRPLYPRERPGAHCIGSWVDPRTHLDECGKSRPTGILSPDCLTHSKSLYRLRYPGPQPRIVRVIQSSRIGWAGRMWNEESVKYFIQNS